MVNRAQMARARFSHIGTRQSDGDPPMRSPLLSENPADIQQMAFDYVEARWGMRVDSATSCVGRWLGKCLAEAYLAGALDHRRALDCAKLLVERK
jgi:hypothetical protein